MTAEERQKIYNDLLVGVVNFTVAFSAYLAWSLQLGDPFKSSLMSALTLGLVAYVSYMVTETEYVELPDRNNLLNKETKFIKLSNHTRLCRFVL